MGVAEEHSELVAQVAYVFGVHQNDLNGTKDLDWEEILVICENIVTDWNEMKDIQTHEEEGYVTAYAERVFFEKFGENAKDGGNVVERTLRAGDLLYYLDGNAYEINDIEEGIKELIVIEEDGKLYARGKDGYFTIKFEVTGKTLAELNIEGHEYIFATRKEAEARHQENVKAVVRSIHNRPKEKLIQEFYREWLGEGPMNMQIIEAMQQKIKKEFGVDISDE